MQPVEPSTIVRGPDALTISFMTRADSHPWHVRCPEVKYSSRVTRLTPLKGSRICVALLNVSAMVCLLVRRYSVWLRRPINGFVLLASGPPTTLASARRIPHPRSAPLRLRLPQLFIFARLAFGCASPSYSYSLGSPSAAPHPAIHIRSARLRLRLAQLFIFARL